MKRKTGKQLILLLFLFVCGNCASEFYSAKEQGIPAAHGHLFYRKLP